MTTPTDPLQVINTGTRSIQFAITPTNKIVIPPLSSISVDPEYADQINALAGNTEHIIVANVLSTVDSEKAFIDATKEMEAATIALSVATDSAALAKKQLAAAGTMEQQTSDRLALAQAAVLETREKRAKEIQDVIRMHAKEGISKRRIEMEALQKLADTA